MSQPASAQRDALLDVQHLTTAFGTAGGQLVAVNDVSLQVQRGETLGLVGESGCGKSVTALSIMRLVQPPGRVTQGRIIFRGRDLMELSEREMQQLRGAEIALILQESTAALNPVFTIGDQIEETLIVHGRATHAEARARAVELLAAVRLPDPSRRAREYCHQLSGGMRQRALIAMALACRPCLVMADEPTTALDATVQSQIVDLLLEMKRAFELSVLLITHDLGVVAEAADRVAVMYAGRIVEAGPARDVFHAPLHPYTRGLLASIPGRTPGRLRAIEGSIPDLAALPKGCAFAPRCSERMPQCDAAAPAPVLASPNREVRCYLHGQDGS